MLKRAVYIGVVIMGACCIFVFFPILRGKLNHKQAEYVMRISVILPHSDQGYWTSVAKGVEEASNMVDADVKISIPQLNYNVPQMTELIKRASAAKVDAIIVQGIQNEEYLTALKQAADNGAQIILVDTDVANLDDYLYIGTDNYNAGVLIGEKAVEMTGGKAKIAVISGEENYPNLEERYTGLQDAIRKYPAMELICLLYDQYDTLTVMQNYYMIINTYPEVDTIICIEGTGGQTFGSKLTVKNKYVSHMLSFDLSDDSRIGLQNDVLDGMVVQQSEKMGKLAILQAVKYYETGAYSSDKIYTDVEWITATDLDEEGAYEP